MSPRRGARWRALAESTFHGVALALLVWAAWRSIRPKPPASRGFATAATLRAALTTWSTVTQPPTVHVSLDSLPSAADRQWLAALPGAGTSVAWDHGLLVPLALTVDPVADPRGTSRVRIAAVGHAPIVVSDAVGVLDTAKSRPGGNGMTLTVPGELRTVDAVTAGTRARAMMTDSLVLRRLLVVGRAGWEARFVVDALEERGWRVDARLGLAPKNDIAQGPPGAIDTARYAAVVVLDTSAVSSARLLIGYVQSGGGLVLAGATGRVKEFRAIAAGVGGATVPATLLTSRDSVPEIIRAASELVPVTHLEADAIPLETRASGQAVVAVAARRVGAGRVVQAGYTDTWRWRMIAGDGVAAHRNWWTQIVSEAAYAPALHRSQSGTPDPAPIAQLAATLGSPVEGAIAHTTDSEPWNRKWIFAVILLALLAEWASRRSRGSR